MRNERGFSTPATIVLALLLPLLAALGLLLLPLLAEDFPLSLVAWSERALTHAHTYQ